MVWSLTLSVVLFGFRGLNVVVVGVLVCLLDMASWHFANAFKREKTGTYMHSRLYTYTFSLGDNDAPATVKAPLFIYMYVLAWDYIWHFWHCAPLVCVLFRGPWTVCEGWQHLVLSQPPSIRGSTGFGPWANPVHIVLSAPLWLDMSPRVWLSQIRWWYPVVKGGSSQSISVSSLWYPDLHWKSCRLCCTETSSN